MDTVIDINTDCLSFFVTSRIDCKLLIYFANNSDSSVSLCQLSKLIKENNGNIVRRIKNLEKINYIKKSYSGKRAIYSANKNCTFLCDVINIIDKFAKNN